MKHIIQYIEESSAHRKEPLTLSQRTRQAYYGEPSKRRYGANHEKHKGEVYEPARETSTAIYNGVESVVSAAMGGVHRFEFTNYDPQRYLGSEISDLLDRAAQQFYTREKVEQKNPQLIRTALTDGSAYYHLNYDKKEKRPRLAILPIQQMLLDPIEARLSEPRYIGHQQRESLEKLKERLGGKKLKGVDKHGNKVDIEKEMLKLSVELSKCSSISELDLSDSDPIRQEMCLYIDKIGEHIAAKKNDKDSKYVVDDVEVSYLYEACTNKLFTVVNRKYIIKEEKNPYSKNITVELKGNKTKTMECKLTDPYIPLWDEKHYDRAYPTSRLHRILDDFDKLCDMKSILCDTVAIAAPLTFIGSSQDAEKVARALQISGEIIDMAPTDIGVLAKSHDYSGLLTNIQIVEENIKRTIGAVDAFQLQGMIGDRASAKEVISANGQIQQRQNSFLANIETAMACLGEKFLKMTLIFDDTISYSSNNQAIEKETKEIMGDYLVSARLKSSVKIEQSENARRALETLSFILPIEGVNKQTVLEEFIPIILEGTVSREQMKGIFTPPPPPPAQVSPQAIPPQGGVVNPASIPPEVLAQGLKIGGEARRGRPPQDRTATAPGQRGSQEGGGETANA